MKPRPDTLPNECKISFYAMAGISKQNLGTFLKPNPIKLISKVVNHRNEKTRIVRWGGNINGEDYLILIRQRLSLVNLKATEAVLIGPEPT